MTQDKWKCNIVLNRTIVQPLREKCPYSKFLWSVFSRIWIEYGEILRISPYSVRMRENTNHKNSEYGHFSRSERDSYYNKTLFKDVCNQICI